ncbi:hypothetical protein MTBSS4_330034 [Magnetospirillum sp. SS-4]|nr:hypothetical protein MTBSS4_330034 [Magnetospirillum sp. SS-4]
MADRSLRPDAGRRRPVSRLCPVRRRPAVAVRVAAGQRRDRRHRRRLPPDPRPPHGRPVPLAGPAHRTVQLARSRILASSPMSGPGAFLLPPPAGLRYRPEVVLPETSDAHSGPGSRRYRRLFRRAAGGGRRRRDVPGASGPRRPAGRDRPRHQEPDRRRRPGGQDRHRRPAGRPLRRGDAELQGLRPGRRHRRHRAGGGAGHHGAADPQRTGPLRGAGRRLRPRAGGGRTVPYLRHPRPGGRDPDHGQDSPPDLRRTRPGRQPPDGSPGGAVRQGQFRYRPHSRTDAGGVGEICPAGAAGRHDLPDARRYRHHHGHHRWPVHHPRDVWRMRGRGHGGGPCPASPGPRSGANRPDRSEIAPDRLHAARPGGRRPHRGRPRPGRHAPPRPGRRPGDAAAAPRPCPCAGLRDRAPGQRVGRRSGQATWILTITKFRTLYKSDNKWRTHSKHWGEPFF